MSIRYYLIAILLLLVGNLNAEDPTTCDLKCTAETLGIYFACGGVCVALEPKIQWWGVPCVEVVCLLTGAGYAEHCIP